MTGPISRSPMQALARSEHAKGVMSIEDTLDSARAALRGGQPEIYKARLQSAYLSLGLLMKQEVV